MIRSLVPDSKLLRQKVPGSLVISGTVAAAFLVAWLQSQIPVWLIFLLILGGISVLWLLADDFQHLAIIYIIAVLFSPSLFRELSFVSSGIRVDHIVLAGVAFLLTLRILMTGRMRSLSPLVFLYMVYLASVLMSVFINIPAAAGGKSILLELTAFQGVLRPFVVLLVFTLILRDERQVKQIILAILLGGAIMTLLGILQFARIEQVVDFTAQLFDKKVDPIVSATGRGPVVGTFDGLHNSFAIFLSMLLTLTLTFLWTTRLAISRFRRGGLLLLSALTIVPLLGTFSRTGFIAALVMMGTLVILERRTFLGRRFFYLVGFAILVTVAAVVAAAFIDYIRIRFIQELLSVSVLLNDPRYTEVAPNLFGIFMAHPIFGAGFDLGTAGDIGYLVALATKGLVGFTLFHAMIVYILIAAHDVIRANPPGVYRPLAIAVLAITLGLLVASLANVPFETTRIIEIYWLLVACLIFAKRDIDRRAASSETLTGGPADVHEPARVMA